MEPIENLKLIQWEIDMPISLIPYKTFAILFDYFSFVSVITKVI